MAAYIGMISLLSVMASLVVLNLVQQANCASLSNEHPLVDYVIVRPQIKVPLEKALEQLNIEPETAQLETINQAIIEASQNTEGSARYVYQALKELLNKTELYIPRQTVAYSVLIQALDEFAPYRKFVEQGKERIVACSERLTLDKVNYWLDKFDIHSDFFTSLKDFFKAALNHKGDDESYLEELKKLDLETDKVNAEQMRQVAGKQVLNFVELQPGVSETIENFLADRCTFYYNTLFRQMNLINLSQSLGHGPFDAKLQEYNEYNRICVAWHKQSQRAKIMQNIMGGQ